MVASDSSAGGLAIIMDDHFERVAAVYESRRTTDEAPVRRISQFLPDRPVVGLEIGCGTGRYPRLLSAMLPAGSLLIASDMSAAMLAELKAGKNDHGSKVVPLLSTAEEPPWADRESRPGHRVQLCSPLRPRSVPDRRSPSSAARWPASPTYTRTPEQNARTIWGRHFPGFNEREQSVAQRGRTAGRRRADQRAADDRRPRSSPTRRSSSVQRLIDQARGTSPLDLPALHTGRVARGNRGVRRPA